MMDELFLGGNPVVPSLSTVPLLCRAVVDVRDVSSIQY